MDKKNINFLEELLYNTEKDSTISRVRNIDDSLLLHVFAANYNWNSGFDVPKAIIENENCDFGTGLLLFHYADGYRMLENPDDVSTSTLKEWKDFLVQTYNKLINLQFKSQNISFDPELTKIQKFKLKKSNPNIPDILLDKSPGHVVDVPKI
ncbi:DUF4274 domain-containing protein [Bacillus sonorensis]|uniref:DUF4274 domain-containing protein n=1 Tax=Bacillus sonorensis TaxID=119858 RepID=UPI00227F41B1|nr:DUF4274 domain-containing protein [Bacillus sonorensis]MCY8033999.1 DUF4274 domain-containing protein [Bacillus sonorensis]MCY8565310.1 DUF4274 domain-containing protein [Bacillus sonorensis]